MRIGWKLKKVNPMYRRLATFARSYSFLSNILCNAMMPLRWCNELKEKITQYASSNTFFKEVRSCYFQSYKFFLTSLQQITFSILIWNSSKEDRWSSTIFAHMRRRIRVARWKITIKFCLRYNRSLNFPMKEIMCHFFRKYPKKSYNGCGNFSMKKTGKVLNIVLKVQCPIFLSSLEIFKARSGDPKVFKYTQQLRVITSIVMKPWITIWNCLKRLSRSPPP